MGSAAKSRRRPTLTVWLASLLVLASACASSGDDSPSLKSSKTRSPTCLAWQKATCDFNVDRCGLFERGACDDTFGSLYCRADGVVQPCFDALATAPCGATPDACYGVADTQPAIEVCRDFEAKYCDRAIQCKVASDPKACVASVDAKLACAGAIGISPSLDDCLAAIPQIECSTFGSVLPTPCKGLIKTSSSAKSLTTDHPGSPLDAALGPADPR